MKSSLIFLFLLPLFTSAQWVKINALDTSTGKWRIESIPVTVKASGESTMVVALSAADTTLQLHLAGSGIGAHSVYEDDQLIFLAENDSTIALRSPSLQGYDYGKTVPTFDHRYIVSIDDLEFLGRNTLHSLRKYSVLGFDDVTIEKKDAKKLRELVLPFIDELKRSNIYQAKIPVVPPGFPGGNDVFLKFLNRNLRPLPLSPNEEKKLIIQFRVMTDGRINEMQVKQSAGPLFDSELLRILKRMPLWKPARKGNKEMDALMETAFTFYTDNKMVRIRY